MQMCWQHFVQAEMDGKHASMKHCARHCVWLVGSDLSFQVTEPTALAQQGVNSCLPPPVPLPLTLPKPLHPPASSSFGSYGSTSGSKAIGASASTYLFQCTNLSLSSCYYPNHDQRRCKAPTHQHLWLHSACGLAVFDVLHVAFA